MKLNLPPIIPPKLSYPAIPYNQFVYLPRDKWSSKKGVSFFATLSSYLRSLSSCHVPVYLCQPLKSIASRCNENFSPLPVPKDLFASFLLIAPSGRYGDKIIGFMLRCLCFISGSNLLHTWSIPLSVL